MGASRKNSGNFEIVHWKKERGQSKESQTNLEQQGFPLSSQNDTQVALQEKGSRRIFKIPDSSVLGIRFGGVVHTKRRVFRGGSNVVNSHCRSIARGNSIRGWKKEDHNRIVFVSNVTPDCFSAFGMLV